MFGAKKNRGLYYLLPGMNRANRIRQRKVLQASILVGILVATLVGVLLYWLNMRHINYN